MLSIVELYVSDGVVDSGDVSHATVDTLILETDESKSEPHKFQLIVKLLQIGCIDCSGLCGLSVVQNSCASLL